MADTSTQSGDWFAPSTWNHGVPASSSKVKIDANDVVTLSQTAGVQNLKIASKGELVLNGGNLETTGGTTDNGEILGSGSISGPIGGDGSLIAVGGTLDLTGAVDAQNKGLTLEVDSGATLKLDGAVGAAFSLLDGNSNTDVVFVNGGTLDLSGEGSGGAGEIEQFQATVDNFGAGDKIVVAAAGATDALHFNDKTDILAVTNGSGAIEEEVQLAGHYNGANFSLSYDAATGTDTITTNASCFLAGVKIRTPAGEVAVETLKPGDLVLTTDGVAKPVAWLGRQTIAVAFADPVRVWPVRVKAAAIAENVPSRDLLLSPEHALLIEGMLIQAGALVNGDSIVRESKTPKVFIYYHVELEDHSLIIVENTPAETFLEFAAHLNFDNWAERQKLHPEHETIEALPYPRAKSVRQIPEEIQALLAERAQEFRAPAANAA